MPAEVESMFSVRQRPWHGLGVIIENAPTSKEAIELAGLNWSVEGKPIYDSNGNVISGYIANTRTSDNSVLGIVTNRYKIVQNAEAFAFTDALINDEVHYETAGSLRSGKTVWMLAKLPEKDILGDKFDPYICFTNTHDGTGSIKVCMTPTRVVCNNTLNLALQNASRTWTARHIGDMNSKLAEAKHTLGLAEEYMNELEKYAQSIVDVKIDEATVEHMLSIVFPIDTSKDSERKIRNVEEMKENFFKCYNMPDIAQFKGTGWGVANAVADLVDHYAPSRLTSSYQENNWGKIMFGHPVLDAMNKLLVAA